MRCRQTAIGAQLSFLAHLESAVAKWLYRVGSGSVAIKVQIDLLKAGKLGSGYQTSTIIQMISAIIDRVRQLRIKVNYRLTRRHQTSSQLNSIKLAQILYHPSKFESVPHRRSLVSIQSSSTSVATVVRKIDILIVSTRVSMTSLDVA